MRKFYFLFLYLFTAPHGTYGEIVRGFHFNPRRQEDYQIPMEEMKEHKQNESSTWAFDFENYGNCVRVKKDPFKLPDKFTFCFRINHDISESANFISFIGTKHGRSVLEDFEKDVPWRRLVGEHEMVNLITLHKNHWNTVWTSIHNYDRFDSNGQAFRGWQWYEWESWCIGRDFENGQVTSCVDGNFDGASTYEGEQSFQSFLNTTYQFSSEPGLVTDVLFGCNLFLEDSFFRTMGKMTQWHLFDRILTADEMVGMTTCGGEKIPGNLIDFEKDTFEIFGRNTEEIQITSEEWCPERKFSGVFFHRYGFCL